MLLSNYQIVLLIIFSTIAYMMVVDKNVTEYINLAFKIFWITIQRYFWILRYHPKNPITNFIMARRYAKMAKEFHKEMTTKPPLD